MHPAVWPGVKTSLTSGSQPPPPLLLEAAGGSGVPSSAQGPSPSSCTSALLQHGEGQQGAAAEAASSAG